MRKKRLLFLVIVLVLVLGFSKGVFVAQALRSNPGQAGFFDNVLNFLRRVPNIIEPKATFPESGKPSEEKKDEVSGQGSRQAPVALYKPVIDYEEAVVAAVEASSPSVVSIVVSKDLPKIENCTYDPFADIPDEFRGFFGRGFEYSVPCERGTEKKEVGGGTGFLVSSDGMILTNKHVVSDTKAEYTVLTNDGKKYDAKVLARDPLQDLAIIRADIPNAKSVLLGDSDSVKLGQTAIAIGNSLGEFRNTVSVGVISGLARTITASGGGFGAETISGVMQTDAAINPGNSGGPLLNLKGEVIAINTAIVSGAQNIGFAIPINQAKRDIESVKRTGTIKAPYIGVRYMIVNGEVAKQQKLSVDYGALIRGTGDGPGVMPDSPAARAGLQAEDVILELNGEKISPDAPLGIILQKHNVGDLVTLKIWRDGKETTATVTLGERPEE